MLGTGQIISARPRPRPGTSTTPELQQLATKRFQYANGMSEPISVRKRFAPECSWPSSRQGGRAAETATTAFRSAASSY